MKSLPAHKEILFNSFRTMTVLQEQTKDEVKELPQNTFKFTRINIVNKCKT